MDGMINFDDNNARNGRFYCGVRLNRQANKKKVVIGRAKDAQYSLYSFHNITAIFNDLSM